MRGRKAPARRDRDARDALVLQWQKLPHYVAVGLSNCNHKVRALGQEDAEQVGFLGLIRAAEIWDEAAGVKFSTYAFHSIKRRILQAVKDNGPVRVPRYLQEGRGTQSCRMAARRLKVFPICDEAGLPPAARERDMVVEEVKEVVADAMRYLTERMRQVIKLRVWEGMTLQEVGEVLHVTRERVRQIEREALEAMRRRLVV